MSPLRLVTFDMTGTLLAFRQPVMEQYASAAAKHGLIVNPSNLQPSFKSAWKCLSAAHPNYGRETIGWHQWWREIVLQTFQSTNASAKNLFDISEDLIKHFQTSEAWCLAEGADELLNNLKSQNLTVGVISNFDPRLHRIMKNLNVSKHFSFVLTSYEVGFAKPDGRIFQEALSRSGNVSPAQALHVGNDEELDFQGAKASGFNAVLLTDGSNFPTKVQNISQVEKVIKQFYV